MLLLTALVFILKHKLFTVSVIAHLSTRIELPRYSVLIIDDSEFLFHR